MKSIFEIVSFYLVVFFSADNFAAAEKLGVKRFDPMFSTLWYLPPLLAAQNPKQAGTMQFNTQAIMFEYYLTHSTDIRIAQSNQGEKKLSRNEKDYYLPLKIAPKNLNKVDSEGAGTLMHILRFFWRWGSKVEEQELLWGRTAAHKKQMCKLLKEWYDRVGAIEQHYFSVMDNTAVLDISSHNEELNKYRWLKDLTSLTEGPEGSFAVRDGSACVAYDDFREKKLSEGSKGVGGAAASGGKKKAQPPVEESESEKEKGGEGAGGEESEEVDVDEDAEEEEEGSDGGGDEEQAGSESDNEGSEKEDKAARAERLAFEKFKLTYAKYVCVGLLHV